MPICSHSLPLPSLHPTLAPDPCPSPRAALTPTRRLFDLHQRNSRNVSGFAGELDVGFRWLSYGRKVFSAGHGRITSVNTAPEGFVKKRSIVEHILLLTAKADLSEDEERDMLDYLYTSQYQMSGILALSLGRISEPNVDNFTHAVYMRFQKEEDIAKFYVNPHYLGILKGHVIPYCYGSISVDYESEVEDDILCIFRRGEEYNYGVECVLLFSVIETAPRHVVEDAMATLQNLILEFHSIIVQATKGTNLKLADSEYTHAAVIRFPSSEALEMFRESSGYGDMWRLKFIPIIKKSLLMHFHVNPVGTELL